VAPGYFVAMSVMANSRHNAGFQAMLYDPHRKRQFTDRPIDNLNLGGVGREQFILRTAYPFEALTPPTHFQARPRSAPTYVQQNVENG